MKRVLVLVLLVGVLGGCTIGGSSSVVGRWRARRVIDSTACVQTAAPGGGCEKLISIGRDIPARRFTTMTFTFGAAGYMQQRGDQDDAGSYVGHGAVLQGHFEYLYGRGRWAIGGRLGAEAPFGFDDRVYFLMPVSVVAHLGDLWGSVYVGGGYSPIALEQQYVGEGEMKTTLPAKYHHNSVHAFAGTRFWLSRTLERGFSFNPEVRVETFGDAMLYSMTGNIGLHF
jgi:hypothetical protein